MSIPELCEDTFSGGAGLVGIVKPGWVGKCRSPCLRPASAQQDVKEIGQGIES